MNKICIFGADGRTGIKVVQEAVSRGHATTAFIHNPDSKDSMPNTVRVVVGNILDENAVEQAIKGNDIVISVVGHIRTSDPLMQTKGMKNIVSSMKNNRVTRIISLTGTGVRESGDNPSFVDRIANFLIKILDKARVEDGIQHTKVLKDSGLDWTILRVLKLTDNKFEGRYNLTEHGSAEFSTPREKVAKILVDLAESREFIGKMPISS